MADNDRSVYKTAEGWANKRDGASRPAEIHSTQAEAAAQAREHLKHSGGGELKIMGENGQIRQKDTIGKKDPFPPKG